MGTHEDTSSETAIAMKSGIVILITIAMAGAMVGVLTWWVVNTSFMQMHEYRITLIRPSGVAQKTWTVRDHDAPDVWHCAGGQTYLRSETAIWAPQGWWLEIEKVSDSRFMRRVANPRGFLDSDSHPVTDQVSAVIRDMQRRGIEPGR